MRGIRSEKKSKKHLGITTNILNNYPCNILRLSNCRRVRSSQNKIKAGKQAMAMHLDHMYIECLDTKSSLSKEVEAKHLKDLVLLHLDLIERQAEDIAQKDKIIKELKAENESVSIYFK